MAGLEVELEVDIDEHETIVESSNEGNQEPPTESSPKSLDLPSVADNPEKLVQLPLTRIRGIIKTDPDVKITSQDAVITLAKAAELFIQSLAREAATKTLREKRKTVLRRHLDDVLETKECYSFLEGVLESFEN